MYLSDLAKQVVLSPWQQCSRMLLSMKPRAEEALLRALAFSRKRTALVERERSMIRKYSSFHHRGGCHAKQIESHLGPTVDNERPNVDTDTALTVKQKESVSTGLTK
jgi:hypothetical protein